MNACSSATERNVLRYDHIHQWCQAVRGAGSRPIGRVGHGLPIPKWNSGLPLLMAYTKYQWIIISTKFHFASSPNANIGTHFVQKNHVAQYGLLTGRLMFVR